MMFLSGVSGLGAFDADYVREQMRLRASGQSALIQARFDQSQRYSTGESITGIRAGVDPHAEEVQARIRAMVIAQREAARKKKSTMLIAGGAAAAILAFVALKG